MRFGRVSALVLLAVTAGCSGIGSVDLDEARASLMQADRDFAAATAERGADGWAEWFEAQGIQFPMTGRIDGREAIREYMRPAFAPDLPRLVWEPDTAVVSASGELGYTIGRWRSVAVPTVGTGGDGTAIAGDEQVLAAGNYVSIWRRSSDGDWRVALDIGNSDLPADE